MPRPSLRLSIAFVTVAAIVMGAWRLISELQADAQKQAILASQRSELTTMQARIVSMAPDKVRPATIDFTLSSLGYDWIVEHFQEWEYLQVREIIVDANALSQSELEELQRNLPMVEITLAR